MSRITCCKDCECRTPTCHSSCYKYIQEEANWKVKKAEIDKQKAIDTGLTEINRNGSVTRLRSYSKYYRSHS